MNELRVDGHLVRNDNIMTFTQTGTESELYTEFQYSSDMSSATAFSETTGNYSA